MQDDTSPPPPFLSIIVPCRNEADFIGQCLDSLLDGDYPQERLEIAVIDGLSTDGTRSIVADYARRFPCVRLLDNPRQITPAALNIGITHTVGDLVLRFDAHSRCGERYLPKVVQAMQQYDADLVGGIMVTVPRDDTRTGRAFVAATSHPLGVGNSHFRTQPRQAKWVDTVFAGCYRRSTFQRIGLFNERLARGQDMEFSLRLRRAGGRVLLLPVIASYYYARSGWIAFWKHNWTNGLWAVLPFLHSPIHPVSWRHLVPLTFSSALILSIAAAMINRWGILALSLVLLPYLLVLGAASIHVAAKHRDPWIAVVMPAAFASLHLPYGSGSLVGLLVALGRFITGTRPPRPEVAWPALASPDGASRLHSGAGLPHSAGRDETGAG